MVRRWVVPLRKHFSHASRKGLRWLVAAGATGIMHFDVHNTYAEEAAPVTYSVTVEVYQVRNSRGRVAIGLYDSAASFPKSTQAFRAAQIPAGQRPVRVTFSGLKPGAYAVAVLHDENQNNQMDFNLLGMPIEGYGFSNDATGVLGAPSFEAAAVRIEAKSLRAPLNLRYFGF